MILAYIVYLGMLFILLPLLTYPLYSRQRIKKDFISEAVIANIFLQYGVPTVVFTLILGLRYNVGVDYLSYESIYNSQTDQILFQHTEPLYTLLSFILHQSGIPYYGLVCIISCIFFILFIKSFSDYPHLKNWGIFFLFVTGVLFVFLNVQRQAIAFCIFFYSIRYIYKRFFLKYLLCIFLAMGFHYSAILLLPLYFLGKIKRCLIDKLSIQLLLYIFIFALRAKIEILLIQIALLFAPAKYAGYAERLLIWRVDLGSGMGVALSHGIDVLIIILLNIIHKQQTNHPTYFFLIQRIWLIGTYLELILESNMVLSRIPLYMTPLKIILLSYIFYHITNTWKKQKGILIIFTFIPFFLYLLYFVMLIKNGSSLCSPYQFVNL